MHRAGQTRPGPAHGLSGIAPVALAVALSGSAGFAGTSDPENPGRTAKLTFDDEFRTLSLWNGQTGTWDTDYWYNPLHGNGGSLPTNGEQEWYINSNYHQTNTVQPWSVDKGILTLTGNPASRNVQPLIDGYQYTSGEINSYHSFSQKYGYFEIRCKLPAGQGVWPAFWLLPANGEWPPEIDILEMLGQQPTVLYTSAHYEHHGEEKNLGKMTTVPDMSKAFHTYAVDWEPNSLTWYFDNREIYHVPIKRAWGFDTPMYIETDLALGGYWAGNVDNTTPFPSEMQVAYIRVYSSRP